MATNPRIPERREIPTFEDLRKQKNASPLVPLGILVAALLLIALIVWLPRTPKEIRPPSGAVVPSQPTGNQVELTDFRLSPSTAGGQIYIYGKLFNGGENTINGARANVRFFGADGKTIDTVSAPLEAVDNGVTKTLVDEPIAPNDTRNVRINIEHVPQGWNHQLPSISVEQVTAQGGR